MQGDNLLAQYQNYDPGFQPRQTKAKPNTWNQVGTGMQAAGGGAMAVNPYVGAGLEAAGLLANLYGNYQSQEQQARDYAAQMREYEDQKYYDRKRAEENARLQAMYDGANYAGKESNNLLARYADYNRGIGL